MKPTQFILMPVRGQAALASLASTALLSIHNAGPKAKLKGVKTPFKVLDSIHEDGAKLVEMDEAGAAQVRATQPGLRVVPLVYHQRAISPRFAVESRLLATTTVLNTVAVKVISQTTGAPLAGATVVAFTDFVRRLGAQGVSNAQGVVNLQLPAGVRIQQLYVYPEAGYWSLWRKNVMLAPGGTIKLTPLNLAYQDGVRAVLGAGQPTDGTGVKVGVVDSGVALNHPDLAVAGGRCTVVGENPQDYGPLAGDHGTHVAGIVAAKGTPPNGIRGLAPAVGLYSYRVFPQTGGGASNYAIAKAIDQAVQDGCDLINLSLGGGAPDPLTEAAISDARDAGALVLAATGNGGRQPVSFPASDSLAVAVSATGKEGTFPTSSTAKADVDKPRGTNPKMFLARFSNIGVEVDLTSMGVDILSTVPGGYAAMSGTSMACPAATGVAARLLARKATVLNATRDAQRSTDILSLLHQAAQPVGFGATCEGHGLCK